MNCPRCHNAVLIALEHDGIEVDYCTECEGVWLDEGEFALIVGLDPTDPASEQPALTISQLNDSTYSASGRRCPECGKQLYKTTTGEPPVEIDFCPRECGMWFDKGELQSLLKSADALGDERVGRFLQGIFGNSE